MRDFQALGGCRYFSINFLLSALNSEKTLLIIARTFLTISNKSVKLIKKKGDQGEVPFLKASC